MHKTFATTSYNHHHHHRRCYYHHHHHLYHIHQRCNKQPQIINTIKKIAHQCNPLQSKPFKVCHLSQPLLAISLPHLSAHRSHKNEHCPCLGSQPRSKYVSENKREVVGQIWFAAESEKYRGEYQRNPVCKVLVRVCCGRRREWWMVGNASLPLPPSQLQPNHQNSQSQRTSCHQNVWADTPKFDKSLAQMSLITVIFNPVSHLGIPELGLGYWTLACASDLLGLNHSKLNFWFCSEIGWQKWKWFLVELKKKTNSRTRPQKNYLSDWTSPWIWRQHCPKSSKKYDFSGWDLSVQCWGGLNTIARYAFRFQKE